jgi:DNA-binding response OmpR family regulator
MRRILHVENDPLVARALARLLRVHGYEVSTALSYAEGRKIVQRYEIGLFDIDLGDGDGVELAEQLRDRGLVHHILFFTARTDTHTAARASQVGPVISKTSEIDAVLAALAHCMANAAPNLSATRRAVDEDEEPVSVEEQVGPNPQRRAGQRSA